MPSRTIVALKRGLWPGQSAEECGAYIVKAVMPFAQRQANNIRIITIRSLLYKLCLRRSPILPRRLHPSTIEILYHPLLHHKKLATASAIRLRVVANKNLDSQSRSLHPTQKLHRLKFDFTTCQIQSSLLEFPVGFLQDSRD